MDGAKIRRFIHEELMSGDHTRPIDDDTPLYDGIIDSIGLVELIGFLEREFGIQIDESDLTATNFRTVSSIQRFVTERGGTT